MAGGLVDTEPAIVRQLKQRILILDGGIGSELIARGIDLAVVAEANVDAPDVVAAVHEAYLGAGREALTANTFSINRYHIGDRTIAVTLAQAGIRIARQQAAGKAWVLSIGPLKPVAGAEITTAEAEDAVAEIALAMADAGADAIVCETMPSVAEGVPGSERRAESPVCRLW